jgi:hypothetical protein
MFSAIVKFFLPMARAPLRFFQRFRVCREQFRAESLPRCWPAAAMPPRSFAAISGM